MSVFPVQHSYGINQTTGLLSAQQLVKPQDQSSGANNAVNFDDNTLVAQVGPNQVIEWFAKLIWGGNSPGNAKARFTTPAAPASGSYFLAYIDSGAVFQNGIATTLAAFNADLNFLVNGGAGSEFTCFFSGRVVMGANGGQFKIQWSQNVANATPTLLLAGSRFDAWIL